MHIKIFNLLVMVDINSEQIVDKYINNSEPICGPVTILDCLQMATLVTRYAD